jgi:hypothetical protein
VKNKLPIWSECTYCGMLADTYDHVIPLSWQYTSRRQGKKDDKRKNCVPACHQCNSFLGNTHNHTIHERANFVADRIAVKYSKILSSPMWGEEEIDNLEDSLKTHVKHFQQKRRVILDRLRWAKTISYMEGLTTDHVWYCVDKGLVLTENL